MSQLLQVVGRFHPLLLHLPIGTIVGLVLIETICIWKKLEPPRAIIGWLVALASLTGIATAVTGLILAESPDYSGDTVDWHRRLGVCVGIASLLFGIAYARRSALYRPLLFVAAAILLPAGHLGATLTHGEDFLFEPLHEGPKHEITAKAAADTKSSSTAQPTETSTNDSVYATRVAPIFQARCASCHSESKQKGGLALHTPDAIRKGGKDGAVFVAGKPDESEIITRLESPTADEDHMPPEGKPQPTAEEIRTLRDWVQSGASFGAAAAGAPSKSETAPAPKSNAASEPAKPPKDERDAQGLARPSAGALAAFADALVHVETLAQDSHALWIDFSAVATRVDDATVKQLIEPVRENVAEIGLARSKVGDDTADFAATLPNLTRLDLRGTGVDDAGIAVLAKHPKLAELILAQDKLTDASVDSLIAMKPLRRVFVWNCGISAEGLQRLRAARTDLFVDDGSKPDAAPVEAEKEIKLSSDRPLPGAETKTADALTPINAKCPVTGDPVNPKFLVVYKGKVIGFCCPNCPKTFWAEPEKFESKLQ